MKLVERGAWKDGFAWDISLKRECIPIFYSLFPGEGRWAVWKLCSASDLGTGRSIGLVVTRPYLQPILTLPEHRKIFLLSQLRGRHFMGKSQEGVRFNLPHC